MRLNPLRAVSPYRSQALVACPKCSGLGFLVEHHILGDRVLRIEHHCALCLSHGFVEQMAAREWWMQPKPAA